MCRFLLRVSVVWLLIGCAVGCGETLGPAVGGDAAGSGDTAGGGDTAEEQACTAKATECQSAFWTNSGTCATEPREGHACGNGTGTCGGRCGTDGQCHYPGKETTYQPTECKIMYCDGAGNWGAAPIQIGLACTLAGSVCGTKGICAKDGTCEFDPASAGTACSNATSGCTGACNLKGSCEFPPASCTVVESQCLAGTCNEAGACVASDPLPSGAACILSDAANCLKAGGQCDGKGTCIPTETSGVGGPCKISVPTACSAATGLGTCMANGYCKPDVQVGKPCTASFSGTCIDPSGMGKCSPDGYCSPNVLEGKSCKVGEGVCSAGKCDKEGSCQVITGPVDTGYSWGSGCTKGYCAGFGQFVSTSAGLPCIYGCKTGVCSAGGYCATSATSPLAPEGTGCDAGDPVSGSCVWSTGQCAADGVCIGKVKPKGATCFFGSLNCVQGGLSTCDGGGHCLANYLPVGTACNLWPQPYAPCIKKTGACTKDHNCAPQIDVGGSCYIAADPGCGPGICDAGGKCIAAAEGKSCETKDPNCGPGICTATGSCVLASDGKPCPLVSQGECFESNGKCTILGTCSAVKKPAGATCANAGPPTACETEAIACNGNGSCTRVPKPYGAAPMPVKISTYECAEYVCDGKGGYTTNATPGNACTVASGPCAGSQGVCSASQTCVPVPSCPGEAPQIPCGDFALGKACSKAYGKATSPGSWTTPCTQATIKDLPISVNSGTCGSDGDPCKPKMCNAGLSQQFMCQPVELADGTPCPGLAADPCSAAVCKSGKCSQALKPEGSACTPVSGNVCAEHTCNAKGECVPTAAPVPTPCLISDGDSDCWAKLCDAKGVCQKAPRAAGSKCGAKAEDGCLVRACDGLGACKAKAIAAGTCPRQECSEPTAQFGSACSPGPCWSGTCTALGQCGNAKPKAAGEACTIDAFAGSCDGAGTCTLKGQGAAALTGKLCMGTYPCMKEDVAYGADGVCHGTVDSGAACGGICNPGICSADGTCKGTPAAKGVICGEESWSCGDRVCDGKGECGAQPDKIGTICPISAFSTCRKYACSTKGLCESVPATGQACTSSECNNGVCSADGYCVQVPKVGAPCPSKDPCIKGTCSASGTCTFAPLTGTECYQPGVCSKGVCQAGVCNWEPAVGKSCGTPAWCNAPTCNAKGECEAVVTPGAPCPSTDPCHKGVCGADGKCTSVQLPQGTSCTTAAGPALDQCQTAACDAAGKCVAATASDGTTCHVGCWPGTCSAGKCVGSKGTSTSSPLCPNTVCMDYTCCSGQPMDWTTGCIDKEQGLCAEKPTYASNCADDPCHASGCWANGMCKMALKDLCDDFTVDPDNPPDYCDGWDKCAAGSCYFCVMPYGNSDPYCNILAKLNSKCEDDNPCTLQSCWPAPCTITPTAEGAPCGAFRKCKAGNCALVPPPGP